MPFEITIKQTGVETKKVNGEWAKVDETFMKESDWNNLSFMVKENLIKEGNLDKFKKSVMGYTPSVEREVPVEKEVYKQVVDQLDLPSVVKAINKL